MNAQRRDWLIWAGVYAVLILLTQVGSLSRQIFDWDESTFILLGSDLLKGTWPYIERFDNKPPLIFVLMAGAQALIDDPVIAARLLGDLSLWLLSLAVFAVARVFYPTKAAGAAGLILIALHATPLGQYTSTELPAMAFVMWGLWAGLRWPSRVAGAALLALMLSFATLTRANLAYLAVAMGGYLTLACLLRRPGAPRSVVSLVAYVLAGLAPAGIFVAIYAAQGVLDIFILSTVTVPLNYASSDWMLLGEGYYHLKLWGHSILQFPMLHGGLTLLLLAAIAALFMRLPSEPQAEVDLPWRQNWVVFWVFTVSVVLSVLRSGAVYPHYWLQLYPFAAVLVAGVVTSRPVVARTGQMVAAAMVLVALGRTVPETGRVLFVRGYLAQAHHITRAAEAVAAVRQPGDAVWALERHLILVYLDQPTVSKVVAHPSNITREVIMAPLEAAGYVPPGEFERLLQSRPEFVVTASGSLPFYLPDKPAFGRWLEVHYAVFLDEGDIAVYRRRDLPRLTGSQPGGDQ